ncbi:MAG: RHS repeat-associated core domain-containing protein, partial [Clostridia bacterium]|nr:RHS repeat-associated core domain-containing protein [Clostridia bacterium]
RLTSYSDGTTTAKYEYNADNLRTAKTVGVTRTDYVWDGANLMYEYGGTTGSYAYDMTGILQSGTDTYLKDEHGNVIGKYSSACVSLGAVQYDAFDSKLNTTINDPFGYCGEYLDSESGLIYLRNRYYNSSIGRFITEDPAKDGMNWYAYCGNNPVMFVDPSGYWASDGSDEKYKETNPIVYSALSILTESWDNLDSLEKQGNDLGNLKSIVSVLANKVREIGNEIKVEENTITRLGGLNAVEIVIYNSDKSKGNDICYSAAEAWYTTATIFDNSGDNTPANAFQHAFWNALALSLTNDSYYVRYFTDAHEFGYSINTLNAKNIEGVKMDLQNNASGRYLQANNDNSSAKELEKIVYNAIFTEALTWIREGDYGNELAP